MVCLFKDWINKVRLFLLMELHLKNRKILDLKLKGLAKKPKEFLEGVNAFRKSLSEFFLLNLDSVMSHLEEGAKKKKWILKIKPVEKEIRYVEI